MAIILIANLTSKHLFSDKPASESKQDIYVIGEDTVILTLTINDNWIIKRNGLTWQSTSSAQSEQAIEQMMQSWQLLQADIPAQEPQMQGITPIQVTIATAGKTKALKLMLYPTKQALYIYQHVQKKWYVAPEAMYRQLIPMNP